MTEATLNLTTYRQQFPALTHKTYFNYGGQGPMPRVALDAIRQAHEEIQIKGPFTGAANTWINQETLQTRQAIAAELGVAPPTISLTENVSAGCNIALWGLPWRSGDHILLSDCEHPSVIATVQELHRRFGVTVSTCPLMATLNVGDPVAVIQQYLLPNTKLICLSHVHWNTGQVLPLQAIADICHQNQTLLLVDAAQSVGMLPLNLAETGVDFYAFTGHKWWCGPAGLGGLYVNPDRQEQLSPTFIGWRGILSDAAGAPTGWKSDGSRYEVATSDYALYAGLRAAIALHQSWGSAQARYDRSVSLSQYLWKRLQEIPGIACLADRPPESGLVSFQLTGYDQAPYGQAHQKLVQTLETRSIMVRTIRHPDCIRACLHYFSTEADIDQLIGAIVDYV